MQGKRQMLLPEYHYMSSSDRLNHQQLAMFMPAGELRDTISGEGAGLGGKEDIIAENLLESHEPVESLRYSTLPGQYDKSLYESVRDEGVQEPVTVILPVGAPDLGPDGSMVLGDGHHRVASASTIDPSMEVPVRYHEYREADWADE
jgi:hypothetical protein